MGNLTGTDSINTFEYVAERRARGGLLIGRILLVLVYIAFCVGAFLFCYITRIVPLFSLSPIFLWILVNYTWRYVSLDVKYTFTAGVFVFYVIYANRGKRILKQKLKVAVKDAIRVGWLNSSQVKDELVGVKKKYDFTSSQKNEDVAVMVFREDNDRKVAVYFNAVGEIPKMIKLFNKQSEL